MMRPYIHTISVLGVLAIVAVFGLVGLLKTNDAKPEISAPVVTIAPQLASQSYVRGEGEVAKQVPKTSDSEAVGYDGSLTDSNPANLFHVVSSEPAPSILLQGALVADLETGETYFTKNPGKRWPMASITKLMTAVYASQSIPKSESVALTTAIISHLGDDTSTTGLQAGEVYSSDDLVKAMLTFSSNEAAEGLAEHAGRDVFIQGMRDQASAWNLSETSFVDPTGLSASNQSTPSDLRNMLLRIYKEQPQLLALTRARSVTLKELNTGIGTAYVNINQFAGTGDFIGGKTGYTDEAEGNLVSLFAYENRPIAIIVLGTEDRFGATTALFTWFKRTHTSR